MCQRGKDIQTDLIIVLYLIEGSSTPAENC